MVLYIIRHAEAVEASATLPEEWRYLTDKGRETIEGVARRLPESGKSCTIISSPLVRAVQTAQIVAEKCGRKCSLEISGLLLPNAAVEQLVRFLLERGSGTRSIMVVGHEPQLSALVARLLQHEEIQLKKAGCVVLEVNQTRPENPAAFYSYVTPGKKPLKSVKKAFMATA
ncbi:phosphohistidine phosphatase SixA [Geobacter sp. SVR]|uniref:phosphohistidine phosphatase SixA n=1 Tax=Geobacter sp. SVR TaxID=2495594 RepID=UPI00143EFDAA|nr:phosphohistidine phosphatase SixA [Geobacter sp. SVR]BCS55947.1 phosphohistidine phosphatase [Geobacter sp. SVR]GCF84710.1 phosphohistidine phosphatase [Geobacter sp. SVR]